MFRIFSLKRAIKKKKRFSIPNLHNVQKSARDFDGSRKKSREPHAGVFFCFFTPVQKYHWYVLRSNVRQEKITPVCRGVPHIGPNATARSLPRFFSGGRDSTVVGRPGGCFFSLGLSCVIFERLVSNTLGQQHSCTSITPPHTMKQQAPHSTEQARYNKKGVAIHMGWRGGGGGRYFLPLCSCPC